MSLVMTREYAKFMNGWSKYLCGNRKMQCSSMHMYIHNSIVKAIRNILAQEIDIID